MKPRPPSPPSPIVRGGIPLATGPAARRRRPLLGKALALAVLALGSTAAGAFLFPRLGPGLAPPPADHPAARPAADAAPRAAVALSVDHPSEPATAPIVPAAPVAPPAGPSPFDVPRVEPRLPRGDGAFALAGLVDREIDRALAGAGVPPSPLAGDAEFLRRVTLDLTGRIPTRDQVVAFLDSTDPYKRSQQIDELLASPHYGAHLARIWTDLLVKRDFDNNKNLRTAAFTAWLAEQLNANQPWDRIVTELLTARGRENQAPQTFFLLANLDNKQPSPAKLVGATANLFLGVQLQCAECHVHPFVSKWDQKDFWGLAAFFGHVRAERGAAGKGKKANGPATFTEVERQAAPRGKRAKKDGGRVIRAGLVIDVPDPTDPRKTVRTVRARFFESDEVIWATRAPYRPALAAWLTAPRNRFFARAAVNRTWAHFFARGLVNPLDDMGAQNRPSHPALLDALAGAFTSSRYDLKDLARALCNSRAYQRTSRPLPGNQDDERLFSHQAVKVLSPHQLLDSLAVATQHRERGARPPRGPRAGAKSATGTGGDPRVRFFDAREYDADPTEFTYGLPHLLRLMNSGLSHSSAAGAARLARAHPGEPERVIEEIYLTVLSRRPTPTEVRRIAAYVGRRGDPVQGYAGAFWALLNSAEFTSNH